MATEEELDIIIKARDLATKALNDIQKDLKGIGAQTKKTNTIMTGFRGGLNKLKTSVFSLRGAFAALGVGLLAKSFLEAATTAEQYRVRLKVLMGDTEKANKLFQDMAEFASGVSFEYSEIMGSATALAGVMKGGGEEINKWMPMIADLAATAGMGIQETTSQIIRMYSAGAAAADMFRERGILAMLGFQAGVSTTAEQTRKKLIEAWEAPTSKFRDASVLLSHTWDGMLSMMADAWFQFRNMVMEAGVFDYMKAMIDTLLQKIKDLKERGRLEAWAKSMADKVLVSFKAIILGVGAVSDAFRGWKMIWLGLQDAFYLMIEFVARGLLWLVKKIDKFSSVLKYIAPNAATAISAAHKQLEGFFGDLEGFAKEAQSGIDNALAEAGAKPSGIARAQKLLKELDVTAKEIGETFKKVAARVEAPIAVKGASPLAMLTSDLNRIKELSKTTMAEMDSALQKGTLSLTKYYDIRKQEMEDVYKKEVEYLNKKLELEEKDDKKQAIRDKLFSLEQSYQRELIKLQDERLKKQEEYDDKRTQAEKLIGDIQGRVLSQRTETLRATFAEELRELDNRQNEEMKNIRELTKVIQDESKKRQLIKDAETAHAQEKNQLLLDQERRIQEFRLEIARDTAGGLAQVFSDLYDVTGKKTKEFFYLSKAAAIAEAIINNSLAITKVMAQGGIWGITQAGLIAAKGALEIAKIGAQTMAEGGLVLGKSPHDKADDKLIRSTSGEFMEPVSSVKHYGLKIMEGIRRKIFPKEIFSNFNIPGRSPSSFALAGGGSVPAGPAPVQEGGREIVIANLYDRNEFLEFLSTAKGRGAIVNAVIQERNTVRRALM